MIMKKVLLFMLAVLPLVLGSCSSDDDDNVNGTSGSIDVTVTFNDNDIANKRDDNHFYVYLISTEGYTVTHEPIFDGYSYYVIAKDANGNERGLNAEWKANAVTFDTELTAHVGNYGSVFPYGKCIVILEEWKGASSWYRYAHTFVNESNSIKLEYGSSLWSKPI